MLFGLDASSTGVMGHFIEINGLGSLSKEVWKRCNNYLVYVQSAVSVEFVLWWLSSFLLVSRRGKLVMFVMSEWRSGGGLKQFLPISR